MNTLKGKAVPAGGTIGVVSPGSPYTRYSDVLKGIAWWEARGYRVRLAEGALQRTDYHAGSPETRARDILAMFTDPAVDAIQCLRGGYGSAQVVPLLDYAVIARHPKPFVGFSDITALHTGLLRFTGLVTFYGPSLTMGGPGMMSPLMEQSLLKTLRGDTTGLFPTNPEDPFIRSWGSGRATGRLVGGCLSDLLYTMGTPWELDLDQAIFVIEDLGSSPHQLDRALLQLTQANKFKNLRGVVIGNLPGCEWHEGGGSPFPHTKTLEEVFELRLGSLGIPVLYGFPFGHGGEFATVPLGVQATIDADACTFEITEPALEKS